MFGSYTSTDIDRLIVRGKYSRALKLLRDLLSERSQDIHLRQKLADTLVLCGEHREATVLLESLVEDFARDGFHAKAIAIVKKIQRIEPGREDLDIKLATLVERHEIQTARTIALPPLPAPQEDGDAPLPEAGEPAVPRTEPPRSEAPRSEAPRSEAPPEAEFDDEETTVADATLPDGLGIELDDSAELRAVQGSPLFKDFAAADLRALIGGLNLRTFEPGEIVISEGTPGSSLLVVASGRVRVYVRNDLGHHVQVRTLGPGEFFGEISILTGQPRTATVTAAEALEILELGQETLDRIGTEHPKVPEVIRDFCERRASSPEEMSARHEIHLPL